MNRHITGAIVRRQPFGGWKKSSIGPGSKPGGPGHLHSYGTWTVPSATVADSVRADFAREWRDDFQVDHDPSALRSEANILRYRPLDRVVVRVEDRDDPQLGIVLVAAEIAGADLSVSCVIDESDEALALRLRSLAGVGVVRLRLLAPASDILFGEAFGAGIAVDRAPATSIASIELRHWVLEQSISRSMHRHGRLLRR